MRTLWVLGHQLSCDLQGFKQVDREKDWIVMIEATSRATWATYHKKKLVLIFSAMRHFAKQLEEAGYQVDYRQAPSFDEGLQVHIQEKNIRTLLYHEPSDFRMRQLIRTWRTQQSIETIAFEEDSFIVSEDEWKTLLPEQKEWKLDTIYRLLRKKHGILMEQGKPIGGKWSYDQQNRKPPKKGLHFVEARFFEPDSITKQVIEEVNEHFKNHPGTTDDFYLPVTKEEAEEALEHFITSRLATFGDYQDAMLEGNPYMSHSLISSAINIHLLQPMDVIRRAEEAYHAGLAPLAAVEGFIRQILGWREYIRGVYLRSMPHYKEVNYFEHTRPLPSFFWDAHTDMNCIKQTVQEVLDYGYNHHIQRLMVIGNFANLAGLKPQAVADWFNMMYTDAHDWVVLPNVLGMALYADGGKMSTKPYISSGKYIQKMSNYCQNCVYQVNEKVGEHACPYNALYWDFLMRHESQLRTNPRMRLMYNIFEKMSHEERLALQTQATQIFEKLEHEKL